MNAVDASQIISARNALGTLAWRRMIGVAIGWTLGGLLEASSYVIVAAAIIHDLSMWWPVAAAAVVLLTTILLARTGFLTGASVAAELYQRLGEKLVAIPLGWFTTRNRAAVTQMAGPGVMSMMGIPAHLIEQIARPIAVPVFSTIGFGFVIGWWYAAVLFALLLAAALIQTLSQRSLAKADSSRHLHQDAASAALMEWSEHQELYRSVATGVQAGERLRGAWVRQADALARTNRAAMPATFFSAIAAAVPVVGMLVLLATTGDRGPVVVLAALLLTARAAAPIDDLALVGISLTNLRNSIQNYGTIIAVDPLPEPAHPESPPQGTEITLTGVSYAPVLHDISLRIPSGTTLVIAGATGSGKSTLVNLIMRFVDPDTGVVAIGGVGSQRLSYRDFIANFAFVPQDPTLFTGSIAENIRVGKPASTDAAVKKAADAAQLESVIARLAAGVDAEIGDRGTALSGGERQRVALARALMKEAPILILDEPTSALDAGTDQAVVEAVTSLNATKIIITHRDPATWRPDQIIYLDNGTISAREPS